jgi:glycosyltransferase involved in cell wall biosynthesis
LLVGEGLSPGNAVLFLWMDEAGIRGAVHALGRRDDVPRLTAAMDIAASSSVGEGFPNAVGEAMSCGVPCVVTDVGDAAALVAETGRVVAPRRPEEMARAWEELLSMTPGERAELGRRARRRIEENFSLAAMAGRYEALYREIAGASRIPDGSPA